MIIWTVNMYGLAAVGRPTPPAHPARLTPPHPFSPPASLSITADVRDIMKNVANSKKKKKKERKRDMVCFPAEQTKECFNGWALRDAEIQLQPDWVLTFLRPWDRKFIKGTRAAWEGKLQRLEKNPLVRGDYRTDRCLGQDAATAAVLRSANPGYLEAPAPLYSLQWLKIIHLGLRHTSVLQDLCMCVCVQE